ncbi:MAG TPA: hypothetical protein VN130_10885 [Xanthobacteraceae bacterium]|nr:hypothetical protein [Xanthobacteraceae bacterium]
MGKAIPGLSVQTLPGVGIANARGVDAGKADIGFGNSISTVEGLAGRAPFPKALTNVCNLATIIWSSITASIGVILFVAGLHGYLLTASRYWHSIGLAVAGVLLIEPGLKTDLIGAALKTDLIGAAIAVVIIILQLLTAANSLEPVPRQAAVAAVAGSCVSERRCGAE